MKAAHGWELINPALPCWMDGYNESRFMFNQTPEQLKAAPESGLRTAHGQRDDLLLDVLILADFDPVVFITLDLMGIEKDTADRCRAQIAQVCKIAPERISISTSHTHNGPLVLRGMDGSLPKQRAYWDWITAKMIACVQDCCLRLQPVESIQFDPHPIAGFYNNRNRPQEDYFDQVWELTLLTKQDQPIVRLLNLACHPTILGVSNRFISNDFFGVLRRCVEGYTGIPVMLFNGEAGDVSPRLLKKGVDFNEVQRYGIGIAMQLLDPYHPIQLHPERLDVRWVHHQTDYRPAENEYLIRKKRELEAEMKTLDPDSEAYRMIKTCTLYDVEEKLSQDRIQFTSDAMIADFGAFRIVTVPCEIDTELGKCLREADAKPTFLCAYANGFQYYAVNKAEYGTVFESFVTRYPYGDADLFVDEILKQYRE